ncbi:S-adenosyl-L-methionine-dependent methyltransferase [Parasitella parasitica]|nr:S-adenosyl-L-methionine-dependent methyltransferase [Parasitella parasitica]
MGGNISRDPPNDTIQQHHDHQSQQHRRNSSSSPSSATRKSKSSTLRNSKTNSVSEEKKVPVIKPDKRTIGGRTYHAVESSSYMLPKDDKEIDRLHEEHFVTKELLGFNIMIEALKRLDFQNDSLQVLDVCCGPATWLCETSLDYPSCRFTGIDMCSLWPQVIRPVNLTFTEANVLQGIPYPDKTFDFIQMRFVVLAFRLNEWPFIISEIKRVLKDGGCFQCVELDMRIITMDPTAIRYTKAFEAFCASYGLDASAGAKLDLLLTEGGGMKILQSEYREIPLGWGGPIGNAYIQIFHGALDGLSPWLKRSLGIKENREYESLISKLKSALIQSNSFMGLYAFLVQKPTND